MAPITFAHRGGRADRPENTLIAFRDALARGARGLESDVRLSGDGIPVLIHDAIIRRGLKRTRVRDLPAAELQRQGIPSVAELYEELGDDYELSLDIKEDDAAVPTVDAAKHSSRGRSALPRLWLCSPNLSLLESLRGSDSEVRLVHSTRRADLSGSLERHAATLAQEHIDAVNFHRSDWSLGLVTLYQRFRRKAFAWDVQEARHISAMLEMRVDGVYSDHVERMVAVVSEWAQERPNHN